MAPIPSRQLLAWTLPTIAALLSYLWYKRKRIGVRSDPGDHKSEDLEPSNQALSEKEIKKEEKVAADNTEPPTPSKTFSRSLSGVESTPIDIVLPPKLRASRSASKVVSDEQLDLEIEKMRNGSLFSNLKIETTPPTQQTQEVKAQVINKTPSPTQTKTDLASPTKNLINKKPKNKMMSKEIQIVSEQITSLNITNDTSSTPKLPKVDHDVNNSNGNKSDLDLQRQSIERDSANHSPADVMLASPSLSIISDNHSEGSSDSGKGGSDLATPPPSRVPVINTANLDILSLYECIIPQTVVGRLIGKHGCFVNQIKDKTNAMILVKKHPTNDKLKICSIEGMKSEIEKALKMIRDKFPIKRYPDVTLEQVHITPIVSTVPLIPDYLYLKLVESINNDTILSCMVTPNHLFLQQPTHPSYPSLHVLSSYMNSCYTMEESPLLPMPIPENTICVAYSVDAWYRAMVLFTDDETETSYIKFLDYGGFAYVENSKLRQIRGDFMLLPFQAAECVLANIKPLSEDGTWPKEAYDIVSEITRGHLIYTQIADYTDEGIPLVLCYIVSGPESIIFLNQHLVDEGYAEWVTLDEDTHQIQHQQQDSLEGAVGGIAVV